MAQQKQQMPGQIEPLVDGQRLATPLWYAFLLFLFQTVTGMYRSAFSAWTTGFVPVVTAAAGGPLVYTASCRYRQVGRTVDVTYDIRLTTVGTASSVMGVTLPVAPAAAPAMLAGREQNINGKMVSGSILTGDNTVSIINADNTTAFVNGTRFVISGSYEV